MRAKVSIAHDGEKEKKEVSITRRRNKRLKKNRKRSGKILCKTKP